MQAAGLSSSQIIANFFLVLVTKMLLVKPCQALFLGGSLNLYLKAHINYADQVLQKCLGHRWLCLQWNGVGAAVRYRFRFLFFPYS